MPMLQPARPGADDWTAADVLAHFGPLPLWRIRLEPKPGEATTEDVLAIYDRQRRCCELVDGVLVEKTMGTYESWLTVELLRKLANFVVERRLGMVLGPDGMTRLAPDLIRIPDISFIAWSRLPDRAIPRTPILALAPDLAVEIISPGNTPQEMSRKIEDYFEAGVRQVWYVYPEPRSVHVFTSPSQCVVLAEADALSGGDVLPGFSLPVADLFAEPQA